MKASLYTQKSWTKKNTANDKKKYRRIHSVVKLEGKTTFVNF